MQDPHIHVEKALFGHAQIRQAIAAATGLAPNAPKRVTTGCGKRRPYAMTSTVPERVTCLACRNHAQRGHQQLAEVAAAGVAHIDAGELPSLVSERDTLAAQAEHHRTLADRFTSPSDSDD